MNLRLIVWKELWERPTAMITSVLAILLVVTALVAMRHVTVFSGREVIPGRRLVCARCGRGVCHRALS